MISWPASRAGEVIEIVARRHGLRPRVVEIARPPDAFGGDDPELLGRWIESTAAALGLEAEPEAIHYGQIEQHLASAAPALLRCGDGRLLVLLAAGPQLIV